ncbi:MAG: Cof-type HAD-IIB family hydrolase [Clostridia bacterium]|nr:Cof-type HAD-IIB family hydrolase [Clostridia bacterium]
MKYDIFLSDFDGTLVRADRTVSETNKQAIAKYRAAGGVFAVVTGRALTSILPRLQELGLTDGLAVAFQGAVIAEAGTGKLIRAGGFALENAVRAIRALEAENHHIHIYTADEFYCNRADEALKAYEQICGIKATVVENELLSEKVEREQLKIIKVLAMVEKEERNALAERLTRALGKQYYITCSADFLVEIMPAGESKANAVDFLSKHYGVPIEKIAAIGDNFNDLPMILRAGGKFAVASGEYELKKHATVVPSCEEDGVAAALEIAMGETR